MSSPLENVVTIHLKQTVVLNIHLKQTIVLITMSGYNPFIRLKQEVCVVLQLAIQCLCYSHKGQCQVLLVESSSEEAW